MRIHTSGKIHLRTTTEFENSRNLLLPDSLNLLGSGEEIVDRYIIVSVQPND